MPCTRALPRTPESPRTAMLAAGKCKKNAPIPSSSTSPGNTCSLSLSSAHTYLRPQMAKELKNQGPIPLASKLLIRSHQWIATQFLMGCKTDKQDKEHAWRALWMPKSSMCVSREQANVSHPKPGEGEDKDTRMVPIR